MKYLLSILMIAVAFTLTSCNDNKETEKKINDLENQIAELKQANQGNAATPVATPKPEVKPEGPLPSFQFTETEFDFGDIQAGDVVEHTFEFVNNGEAPLIIQSASATCGCTVPDWPKTPVAVGETAKITAKFNSKGKANVQNKAITITANTWPKQTKLYIKANVLKGTETEMSGPVK